MSVRRKFAGAVIVLGRRTLLAKDFHPDWIKVALCLTTLAVLWRFKKFPEPVVVLAAGVLGLVLFRLGHT